MLTVHQHGPVIEARMSTWYSRAVGYQVSAFLHRGFLIDSGFPRARGELAALLDRTPVTGALITHWHEDHAGNLALLMARGIPVAVSAETLNLHRAMPRVPLYRWATWGHPRPPAATPVPVAHPFELIPTPGHSRDHVAVWDPEERILFTGDLFLGVRASIGHPDESPDAILASVRRVLALEPRVMLDAHRGSVRDPLKALAAKAAWLETTIAAARGLMGEGRSDPEIVTELLGGEDRIAILSGGEMSRRNFVAAIRRDTVRAEGPAT